MFKPTNLSIQAIYNLSFLTFSLDEKVSNPDNYRIGVKLTALKNLWRLNIACVSGVYFRYFFLDKKVTNPDNYRDKTLCLPITIGINFSLCA
jgi:hypothetical protein